MSVLDFSEVLRKREALRADAGATSTTKDLLARSYNGRTVHAVGTVTDVRGAQDELTVLLSVEGEILTCPLVRVHGRSMEEANGEVTSWRIGDRVQVTGKLNWLSFPSELGIGILSAARADPAP
jgi:hypothetical protein